MFKTTWGNLQADSSLRKRIGEKFKDGGASLDAETMLTASLDNEGVLQASLQISFLVAEKDAAGKTVYIKKDGTKTTDKKDKDIVEVSMIRNPALDQLKDQKDIDAIKKVGDALGEDEEKLVTIAFSTTATGATMSIFAPLEILLRTIDPALAENAQSIMDLLEKAGVNTDRNVQIVLGEKSGNLEIITQLTKSEAKKIAELDVENKSDFSALMEAADNAAQNGEDSKGKMSFFIYAAGGKATFNMYANLAWLARYGGDKTLASALELYKKLLAANAKLGAADKINAENIMAAIGSQGGGITLTALGLTRNQLRAVALVTGDVDLMKKFEALEAAAKKAGKNIELFFSLTATGGKASIVAFVNLTLAAAARLSASGFFTKEEQEQIKMGSQIAGETGRSPEQVSIMIQGSRTGNLLILVVDIRKDELSKLSESSRAFLNKMLQRPDGTSRAGSLEELADGLGGSLSVAIGYDAKTGVAAKLQMTLAMAKALDNTLAAFFTAEEKKDLQKAAQLALVIGEKNVGVLLTKTAEGYSILFTVAGMALNNGALSRLLNGVDNAAIADLKAGAGRYGYGFNDLQAAVVVANNSNWWDAEGNLTKAAKDTFTRLAGGVDQAAINDLKAGAQKLAERQGKTSDMDDFQAALLIAGNSNWWNESGTMLTDEAYAQFIRFAAGIDQKAIDNLKAGAQKLAEQQGKKSGMDDLQAALLIAGNDNWWNAQGNLTTEAKNTLGRFGRGIDQTAIDNLKAGAARHGITLNDFSTALMIAGNEKWWQGGSLTGEAYMTFVRLAFGEKDDKAIANLKAGMAREGKVITDFEAALMIASDERLWDPENTALSKQGKAALQSFALGIKLTPDEKSRGNSFVLAMSDGRTVAMVFNANGTTDVRVLGANGKDGDRKLGAELGTADIGGREATVKVRGAASADGKTMNYWLEFTFADNKDKPITLKNAEGKDISITGPVTIKLGNDGFRLAQGIDITLQKGDVLFDCKLIEGATQFKLGENGELTIAAGLIEAKEGQGKFAYRFIDKHGSSTVVESRYAFVINGEITPFYYGEKSTQAVMVAGLIEGLKGWTEKQGMAANKLMLALDGRGGIDIYALPSDIKQAILNIDNKTINPDAPEIVEETKAKLIAMVTLISEKYSNAPDTQLKLSLSRAGDVSSKEKTTYLLLPSIMMDAKMGNLGVLGVFVQGIMGGKLTISDIDAVMKELGVSSIKDISTGMLKDKVNEFKGAAETEWQASLRWWRNDPDTAKEWAQGKADSGDAHWQVGVVFLKLVEIAEDLKKERIENYKQGLINKGVFTEYMSCGADQGSTPVELCTDLNAKAGSKADWGGNVTHIHGERPITQPELTELTNMKKADALDLLFAGDASGNAKIILDFGFTAGDKGNAQGMRDTLSLSIKLTGTTEKGADGKDKYTPIDKATALFVAQAFGYTLLNSDFQENGVERNIADVSISLAEGSPDVTVRLSKTVSEMKPANLIEALKQVNQYGGETGDALITKAKQVFGDAQATFTSYSLNAEAVGGESLQYKYDKGLLYIAFNKNENNPISYLTKIENGIITKIIVQMNEGWGEKTYAGYQRTSEGKYLTLFDNNLPLEIGPDGVITAGTKVSYWYKWLALDLARFVGYNFGHENVTSKISIDYNEGTQSVISWNSDTAQALYEVNTAVKMWFNPVAWYAALTKGKTRYTLYQLEKSTGWTIALAIGEVVTDLVLMVATAGIGGGIAAGAKLGFTAALRATLAATMKAIGQVAKATSLLARTMQVGRAAVAVISLPFRILGIGMGSVAGWAGRGIASGVRVTSLGERTIGGINTVIKAAQVSEFSPFLSWNGIGQRMSSWLISSIAG
ncbi:MAG: hypothetical protein PHV55_05520, partial [Candidatus Omnitrophica bacterium]|nr:hypothetical protein [Candidatus Omnitrophota bacterium]